MTDTTTTMAGRGSAYGPLPRAPRPSGPRFTADAVAAAVGTHPPTPEQRAVIEAPLRPALVVAGAGSGKTETMAARVVWLVANGFVEPDEVLGLTFTRKAAGELADRVGRRLAALRAAGLWQPRVEEDVEALGSGVTVSTYHAYAGRLVRDHGLLLGREPDSRLLTEAAAWQYASEAVSTYDGPMEVVDKAASTVTNAVLHMAGQLAEHLRTVEEVEAEIDRIVDRLDALPPGRGAQKEARDMRARLTERRAVLPVVRRYDQLKRRHDAMDFADQMALAARLAVDVPQVGAIERQRFRAVLLDEFQDTSEAQLELLRALFGDPADPLPVVAVGDPNQSIYGWRGASATTLRRFPRVFGVADDARLTLSTSWRNDRAVLDVANRVAEPLASSDLVLAARAGAGPGEVRVARLATDVEEAEYVAGWIAEHHRRDPGASAAVLCRRRSQFGPVMDALEERGIPYEVLGLGGLLTTPEVSDLVALLHVVADPSRGDQLMRLLTGPLVRLGAADLDGLAAWARSRQRVDTRPRLGAPSGDPDDDRRGTDLALDSSDEPSLVEALTDLPPPDWVGADGQRLGPVALERLEGLGRVVQRLRDLAGLGLGELVGEAERALGLDIEVLARHEYTPATARAHLDAFADVADGFASSADRPTLPAFLAWLEAALTRERGLELAYVQERALDKTYLEPVAGAVQILTVHSAKGLEWDVVAVPGLVEASFPAHQGSSTRVDGGQWTHRPAADRGWIGPLADGGIPYALRGDRDGLPVLDWEAAVDLNDVHRRVTRFVEDNGAFGVEEERRLAYVAFTRARRAMLLSAHVWGTQSTPRVTSRFLLEVCEAADLPVRRDAWADLPPTSGEDVVNPAADVGRVVAWPSEPVRDRRVVIAASAERIRSVMETDPGSVRPGVDPSFRTGSATASGQEDESHPENRLGPGNGLGRGDRHEGEIRPGPENGTGAEDRLGREIDLLLAERARRREPGPAVVDLPRHLSTSSLVALATDPDAYALSVRRPVPTAPARSARRGTAFHAWVEEHYSRAAIVDILDLPGSADEDAGDTGHLEELTARFLASPWASMTPLEVETSIETVIDGVAVRGRIDAVFAEPPGPDGEERYVVVDWKTGPPPTGRDARVRSLQLGAYALAFARLHGLAPGQVRGAFFYAATGDTVYPDLPSLADISAVIRGA